MTRDAGAARMPWPNQRVLPSFAWAALAGALALTTPQLASAQPFGWVVEQRRFQPAPEPDRLLVTNLANGTERTAFVMPPGVELGFNGVITPDGRYYLLATNVGIARFRTDVPAFERFIGPAAGVTTMSMTPSGTRVHAFGPFGHTVIDWETGGVLSATSFDRVYAIYFSPDGAKRVEARLQGTPLRHSLTAFSENTGALLWTRTIDDFVLCSHGAVSDTHVARACDNYDFGDDAVIIWNLADGAELGRVQAFAGELGWDGNRLLVSHWSLAGLRLSAYDVPALNETLLVERPFAPGQVTFPENLRVSRDGRHVYWATHHRDGEHTAYTVVDLATDAEIDGGVLASRFAVDFAISPESRCDLAAPAAVAGQLAGGTVSVPVTPEASCPAWTVSDVRVLNPGPHTGPATLQVHTWPNSDATPRATVITVGTQPVTITQPSSVPTAPDLQATASDDRVVLSLAPAIGAGITSFVVRGAIAGNPLADLLTLPAHLRSWTSPPMPPNDYEVEVVAANGAGRSQPSARITLSLGSKAVPNPPEHLVATAVDDRVELSWSAAPGPVPSEYVIEATPAGNPVFLPVARSLLPSLVATRVPAGSWQVRVRGRTAGGTSPPSQVIAVTTAPCSSPPGPPTAAWAIWTPPAVSVRWSPPLAGSVEEYLLEAGSSPAAADLGQLVVPGGELAYTTDLSSLSAYVRVRARNACGVSAPSADVPIVLY